DEMNLTEPRGVETERVGKIDLCEDVLVALPLGEAVRAGQLIEEAEAHHSSLQFEYRVECAADHRKHGGIPVPCRKPIAPVLFSLEDTSPPWSADAIRPECGHCWRRPRDSEPPGYAAHPGPMSHAAENHSRNPSWPASLPSWSTRETRPRRRRHP